MSRLAVVDTETGGLDPQLCSILSLAVVVWEDKRILDRLELFVCEGEIFATAQSLKVNRMDLDWLRRNGLDPGAAVRELELFLGRHFGPGRKIMVAGHNVAFDIGFLRRLYRLAGKSYEDSFSHRSIDTAAIIQFLMLAGLVSMTVGDSSEAFRYFGVKISESERHTAMGDATATAELLSRLVDTVAREVRIEQA